MWSFRQLFLVKQAPTKLIKGVKRGAAVVTRSYPLICTSYPKKQKYQGQSPWTRNSAEGLGERLVWRRPDWLSLSGLERCLGSLLPGSGGYCICLNSAGGLGERLVLRRPDWLGLSGLEPCLGCLLPGAEPLDP